MGDSKRKLTVKQKLFCELYAKSLNRAQAAQKAYPNMKYESAKVLGSRMLSDDNFQHVREYADKCVKNHLIDIGVNKESILNRLAKIAYADLPEVTVNSEGISINGVTKTIASELEFKHSKWGDSVKWKSPDQLKALQMLNDIHDEINRDNEGGDEMTFIKIGRRN